MPAIYTWFALQFVLASLSKSATERYPKVSCQDISVVMPAMWYNRVEDWSEIICSILTFHIHFFPNIVLKIHSLLLFLASKKKPTFCLFYWHDLPLFSLPIRTCNTKSVYKIYIYQFTFNEKLKNFLLNIY